LAETGKPHSIEQRLRESFGSRGFVFLGVTGLDVVTDHERFMAWLEAGNHAGMEFLSRNATLRRDLRNVLPDAESAVIFALPYAPAHDAGKTGIPRIAKYARLRDYHKVMWEEGEAAFLDAVPDTAVSRRVCVDSAPVLERALAARTGSGFIGKNTCFIAGKQGSFLLLGVVLTSLKIAATGTPPGEKSRRNANACGSCQRCQAHCPTGALDIAWNLDSRKCLSYWTIEHRGTIPEEFWPWLAKYWYGCDICQDVCPYNRTGRKLGRSDLIRSVESVPLSQVATMDQAFYERIFGGTAMTRAKRNGLRRNALIAMAVTNDPALDEILEAILRDTDEDDMFVTETARQIIRFMRDRKPNRYP
jgi:epoxyqueuosine reductase